MVHRERGVALIASLMMLALLAALLGAYFTLTNTEQRMAKSSKDSQSGFNAAEAGLNIRAQIIRQIFKDYALPDGTPPSSIAACDSGSIGSGDYACETYDFDNHHAVTYVTENPGNPLQRVVPPGEIFSGLSAQEYRYTVRSVGRNQSGSNEAILDLAFFSRLVPLFQFAMFFNEDLEIFNGATLAVDGRVHTNSDFYLSPQDGGISNLTGQLSVAGTFYRGKKSENTCTGYTGTARVSDTPDKNAPNYITLPACSGSRSVISNVTSWKDNIDIDLDPVEIPSPSVMDAFSTGDYWQKADLRLVLRLNASGNVVTTNSPTGVEVVGTDGVNIAAATNALHNALCTGLITEGAASYSVGNRGAEDASKLRLYREYQHNATLNNFQRTLEVDMRALLNCIQRFPTIMDGKLLNDNTQQGLVFFFAVDGPLAASTHNNYSVRIRNAASLQSNIASASVVKGLTLVTDQGLIVWGNYNSTGWVPSALMGDTLWLLSNSWTDADSLQTDTYSRDGNATTVYAAVLSGIRRTGNANGVAGQDKGVDTNGGGVINIFRFNEWFRVGTATPDFTYVGSLVSLGPTRRSDSTWGPFTYYSAPNRVWSYETRFNDPDQLPPMTPAFVHLKQELFVRDYDTGG
jgi:hypothetical protein